MRTPEEAIAEILDHVAILGEVESTPLLLAQGRVLARDVVSDIDLPPFRKSAMDGFAVHTRDFRPGSEQTALRMIGESRAGHPFRDPVPNGACVAIYTGAELPNDCDAVVVVEKSTTEGDSVALSDHPRDGQNICNRGEDLHEGATVLSAMRRLSATDLSVLASVGCDPVPVFRRPRVIVLTTGDELVPAHQKPGPGQIREGNTLHLAALASRAGAEVVRVDQVADVQAELEASFAAALDDADAVITTGGVSMGKYDLVAQVFERLGVKEIFHKVAIKPGKPMWFGMRGEKPVFALPGNPVSCLLDHEVFVRPALAKLEGADPAEWRERRRRGRWVGPERKAYDRQQNIPASVRQGADGIDVLEPLVWSSSADIVGLASADGMAIVPAGRALSQGEMVDYRPLRESWAPAS